VQKLFNGRTKFGLNKGSIEVDTIVMDDAHACADRIREACRIRIPSDEPGYALLKTLFAPDLEHGASGPLRTLRTANATRCCRCPIGHGWNARARSHRSCPPRPIATL
jgi:hypothetical protein